MNIFNKMSKIEQLQLVYFSSLMKNRGEVINFDFESRTLRVLNLRKEFFGKYASNDGGVYCFNFTKELIQELRDMSEHVKKKDSFCIALYCEDTEQPCILTFPEFDELVIGAGRTGAVNLFVRVTARTFNVRVSCDNGLGAVERRISKKASTAKIFQ